MTQNSASGSKAKTPHELDPVPRLKGRRTFCIRKQLSLNVVRTRCDSHRGGVGFRYPADRVTEFMPSLASILCCWSAHLCDSYPVLRDRSCGPMAFWLLRSLPLRVGVRSRTRG